MLAKLNEDFLKVRDVSNATDIESLMNYLIRILNIKISNEEDQEQLDFQMPLILDFIRSKFGTLTIPEIKEAFKMYVAKEFDIKVFRMLDCIVVGEVLEAFTNFRNESLRVYDHKKSLAAIESVIPNLEQIREDFLLSIFDDLHARGYAPDAWMLWTTEINSKDLTAFAEKVNATTTDDKKREMYAKEVQLHLEEIKAEAVGSRMHSAKFAVENLRAQITKNLPINVVVKRCRNLMASKYLKDYLEDFEEFKKQIEK